MSRKSKFVTISLWVLILSSLLLGAFLLASSYYLTFAWIKPKIDALSQDGTADLFTVAVYKRIIRRVQIAGVVAIIVGSVPYPLWHRLALVATGHLDRLVRSWRKLLGGIWTAVREEERIHLVALGGIFVVAIALRLLFLFQPIRYDEAFTFLTYASKPFVVAISRYGDPNNHLLNTVLIKIASAFFGDAPWAIRLPAFTFGLLIVPATYTAVRTLYDKHAALLASALVAASSALVEFSTNARGYTMVCLIFLAALTLAKYVKDRSSDAAWVAFTVSCALGFYAMPTTLYPFGIVVVWYSLSVLRNGGAVQLKSIAVSVLVVIGLTFVFYAPVIVVSGLEALVNNPYVRPQTESVFFSRMANTLQATWHLWNRDIPTVVVIFLVAGFVLTHLLHRRLFPHHVPVALAALVWLVPVLLIQRVAPYPRVWLFLIPLYLGVAAVAPAHYIRLLAAKAHIRPTPVIAALSLALSLWLGVNVMRSGSVLASPDTGTFPEAEDITLWLKHTFRPGDTVIMGTPTDYPTFYYFSLHHVSNRYFAELRQPEKFGDRLFAVVDERTQTLDQLLQYTPRTIRERYSRPEIALDLSPAKIYLLRRIGPNASSSKKSSATGNVPHE